MKRWILAAAAGALALAPLAARAAVDTTHHDMTAAGYNISQEKCAYCHSASLASANTANNFEQVGTFCVVVCHDGTVIANAEPRGPGYMPADFSYVQPAIDVATVAFDQAHGEDPAVLPALPSALEVAVDVQQTGWPHTAATDLVMECTSCHAVHDGTNPPFLNAPLSNRTDNAGSFCQRCHDGSQAGTRAGRYQDIATMGAHPTEFTYLTAVPNGTRPAPKLGREMLVKSAAFWQHTGQTTIAAFNAPGPDWNMGGHFIAAAGDWLPDTDATDAGMVGSYFGCYTCHPAHQANTVNTGSTFLLLADPDAAARSVLCTGCHGDPAANAGAGSIHNPGVTVYYHPANDEAAAPYQHDHTVHGGVADPNVPTAGNFPIPIRGDTTGAALNAVLGTYIGGNANEVLCVSCHNVHAGVAGQMAIRLIDNTVQITNGDSVCLACHQVSTDNGGLASNWHHPGQNLNYNAAGNGGFPAAAAWVTGDALGSLTDGLSCPDCHTFQGTAARRATAHNW